MMKNQAQAQQEQAQQQAQDPVLQLQQQELQIKAQEIQRKAQKDQQDIQLRMQQQQIEQQRIQSQERAALASILAKREMDEKKITSNEEIEGMRIGIQVAKDRAEAMKPPQKVRPE
jgi:hypothetical protein